MKNLTALTRETIDLNDVLPGSCADCDQSALKCNLQTKQVYLDKKSRDAGEVLSPDEYEATGLFRCNFLCQSCGSEGIIAGKWRRNVEFADYPHADVEETHVAQCLMPAPNLFDVPVDTPELVSSLIKQAFSLFWIDPAACVSRCRASIERLLDYFRVKKTSITKQKKRVQRTLHSRLEVFSQVKPQAARLLMAVKWIGNDGAHRGETTRSDAVDAFELIEASLKDLFDDSHAQLAKLATSINKKKRPRSRRR